MADTDVTIDGQNLDDTGAPASHFVKPPKKKQAPVSAFDAEMDGDYVALAQIKLANARRELNEHTDVNGDGVILGSNRQLISGVFFEDKYGLFHSDGEFHDKFGGTYDRWGGYEFKDGSYTSTNGSHYNAKTNKYTLADGSERKAPPGVTKPEDVKALVKIDTAVANHLAGQDGKVLHIDPKAANSSVGGALTNTGAAVTQAVQAVSNQVVATRQESGKSLQAPVTKAEIDAAQAKIKAAQAEQKAREQAFQAERAASGAQGLTAVSSTDATKAIGHVHVPQGTTPAPQGQNGTASGTASTAAGAANAAASDTWYADTKNKGYWDSSGGYYDDKGGYWDPTGGYYDARGGYTDPKGNYTWPDGTFMDAKGNYVDTSGALWTADGTKFDTQPGVDYKAELKKAIDNNTTYVPSGKGTSISIDSDDDAAPAGNTAPTATPVNHVDNPSTPAISSNVAGLSPSKLPDLSTTSTSVPGLNVDTSKYTLVDTTATTPPAAGSTSPAPLTLASDDDFYSMFNGFRTSIIDNKSVTETKFFAPLSPSTPSPSLLTSPLALNATSSVTVPLASTDTKVAAPKPGM